MSVQAGRDRPRRGLEELGLRSEAREAADLRAEMEAHLQHRIDDLIGEGVAPAEARRRARREFGDVERIADEVDRDRSRRRRRRRGWAGLGDLVLDLRFALRQLRRAPAFALVAVSTLALGIGAASTIFGVVRSVVLDPLPFAEPSRVVELESVTPSGGDFSVSEPMFLEWRGRARTFEGIAALGGSAANLQAPERRTIDRVRVNADFFDVLGVPPVRGRTFDAGEDGPGTPDAVAMISESFWETRFGRDPEVLRRTITLDGATYPVVGVYPRELDLLLGDDGVVTPLAADPASDRGNHDLTVVARLAPGATLATARDELVRIAGEQGRAFEEDRGWSAKLTPIEESLIGTPTLQAGWLLLAAGALLLLTACVNVSSLLLARATVRTTEMKVRRALGAATGRLGRQVFTESLLLAVLGCGAGLAVAAVGLEAVRRLAGGRIPRIDGASLDPLTLAVTFGVTLLVALAFGATPLGSLRGRASLRGSARGAGPDGRGVRRALVGVQVAVSVMLLVGTGLLLRSFVALSSVDPGFEAANAYALDLSMPEGSWDWQERNALMGEILASLEGVPGVEVAGATSVDPFSGMALANFAAPADDVPDEAADFTPVHWRSVTSDFFEAAGVRVLAGRPFEDADSEPRTESSRGFLPGMIDRRLAEEFFGSPAQALGRRIVWGDPQGSHVTVVGVVEPLRDVTLADDPERMIYRLYAEIPWASMVAIVRVREDGAPRPAALRDAVLAAAPAMGTPDVTPLSAKLDRALAEPRFNLVVLAAFAGCGLLLALVGLYGLTAFEVRQRFREIGIRISLGADPDSIRRLILRERVALAGVGAAAGAAGAFLLRRSLESLLYEVAPSDPVTWIGGIGLVLATTALAAWVPARRATRVDPREVLSGE